jgi:hypothetical protein
MRISDQEKNEIVKTFQQTFKHNAEAEKKVEAYSIEHLRQVDEMLGNRDIDAGFRIAIRNQIKRLEEKSQRVFDSKVRGAYIIIGLVSAVNKRGQSKNSALV